MVKSPYWMDKHLWKEGTPRKGARPWKTIHGGITIDGRYYTLPDSEEEWLNPTEYEGKNINWFMLQSPSCVDLIPPKMINEFYKKEEHKTQLVKLMNDTSVLQFIYLIHNVSNNITDFALQQWLMEVMSSHGAAMKGFMIDDLPDGDLKALRESLWHLME